MTLNELVDFLELSEDTIISFLDVDYVCIRRATVNDLMGSAGYYTKKINNWWVGENSIDVIMVNQWN